MLLRWLPIAIFLAASPFEAGAQGAEEFWPRDRSDELRAAESWNAASSEIESAQRLERLLLLRHRSGRSWVADSLDLSHQLLAQRRAAGADSLSIGRALTVLSSALLARTDFDSSATRAREAVRWLEDASPVALAEAQALRARAELEVEQFESARVAAAAARELYAQEWGGTDPAALMAEYEIARIDYFEGHRDRAAEAYARLRATLESKLGSDHPVLAWVLTDEAYLERALGNYERVHALGKRARSLRAAAFGEEDPELGRIDDLIAGAHYFQAHYDEAEQVWTRALSIREAALPFDHAEIALNLGGLALLAYRKGEFDRALQLRERELAIYESRLGPWHSFVGSSHRAIARLHGRLGDSTREREHLAQSLDIKERALGEHHPNLVPTVMDIAHLLQEEGKVDEAIAGYQRALSILERENEPNPSNLATVLNALGNARRREQDYAAALPHYARALEIYRSELGRDHPFVGNVLQNQGEAYSGVGDLDAAEACYRESRRIWEASLGDSHPQVAESYQKLADLLHEQRRDEEALEASLACERIGREHLGWVMGTLAERQALNFASSRTRSIDLALTLASADPPRAQVSRIWDAVAASRAVVLDEMAGRRREALLRRDPNVDAAFGDYRRASERVAKLLVRQVGLRGAEGQPEELDDARSELESTERELARRSRDFRQRQRLDSVSVQEVAKGLPDNSALVAYVRYGHRLRRDLPSDRVRAEDHYLVLVWPAGQEEPGCIDLGRADEIELAIARWQAEIVAAQRPLADLSFDLLDSYRRAGDALRRRIWDPVAPSLAGIERVFLVQDAALHLVSMPSLPVDGSRFLIETGPEFHLLDAERDLLFEAEPPTGQGLLALGGVDFEGQTSTPGAQGIFRGPAPDCPSFQQLNFAPLPATRAEVETVAREWNQGEARVLLGRDADEATLKSQVPGPRVLHLATHGFFLGEDCVGPGADSRGVAGLAPARESSSGAAHPLRLSGVALAGANRRATVASGTEDGILTAEEIVALDLSGVEWVVFSACDTGRGRIEAGEGVFGLRRAAQIAGARTVILSLWAVNDEMAARWMRSLYRGRWQEGRDTISAVHAAGLELLTSLRAGGTPPHPVLWAAFVAAGRGR